MKKIPNIWWDFEEDGSETILIVESDHPDYPILREYRKPPSDSDFTDVINLAEVYIKDIKEGRISFHEEGKRFMRAVGWPSYIPKP